MSPNPYVTEPNERVGRPIFTAPEGHHNHFPTWSPQATFIYFVHGFPPDETDIWRIRPTGGEPERITLHNATVSYPALLDERTMLYLATAENGSGPWLYVIDVERQVPHRVSVGVQRYTSIAASADGRRPLPRACGGCRSRTARSANPPLAASRCQRSAVAHRAWGVTTCSISPRAAA